MPLTINNLTINHSKSIAYLKFLITSTNAHGVHSPFVFNYVTQCLYAPQKRAKDKAVNVLLKSLDYFNAKTLQIQEAHPAKKQVAQHYPHLRWEARSFDVVYTDRLTPKALNTLLSEGMLHNDSLLLINAPYKTSESQKNWKALIASPKITVSLDLFYLGVLFIRKEQVKEHFTIRI